MTGSKLLKPKDDAEFLVVGEAAKLGRVSLTGVVKGVHLLGFTSKNGRKYSPAAMINAVEAKLYIDVPVFANHDSEDVSRNANYTDKMGFVLESYYYDKLGIIGDVQFNTEHPHYKSTVWWIDNNPTKVGFSHVAPIQESKDGTVTAIGKPYSVDLVSCPATTRGLIAREGVIETEIAEDRLISIHSALCDLFYKTRYPLSGPVLTQEEQALQYVSVLQDAIAELTKLGNSKTQTEQESVMDLKTLTLELLKTERPDLISTIATEAIKAEQAIDAAVSEAVSGIPETSRSVVFMKLVRESIASGKDVKDLVEDRKLLTANVVVESAPLTAPKTKPVIESVAKFDIDQFESTLLSK